MRTRLGVASALFVGAIVTRARAGATRTTRDEWLEAELRDTILELRRIERDLHDGCQQRLIALRVKLALAQEIVAAENPPVGDLIDEIAADAETALEDLHALVHGIYPGLLTDRGLPDALTAMVRTAPVPARVLAQGLGR